MKRNPSRRGTRTRERLLLLGFVWAIATGWTLGWAYGAAVTAVVVLAMVAVPVRTYAYNGPTCPKCGDRMRVRSNMRDRRKPITFLGCVKYPRCKGVREN